MDLEISNEVYLVGDMNNWDPTDMTYSLTRNNYCNWVGIFGLEKGTEYKIMYDSNDWDAEQHIGTYEGSNLIGE